MRFWDSSAIVPLCTRQEWTEAMAALVAEDQEMAVWWSTPVEVASALARLWRDGTIPVDVVDGALARLDVLAESWIGVEPATELRDRALRLLRVHALRAADALQLAAALVWAEDDPRNRGFVCLDGRLREAARREGFTLVPERT